MIFFQDRVINYEHPDRRAQEIHNNIKKNGLHELKINIKKNGLHELKIILFFLKFHQLIIVKRPEYLIRYLCVFPLFTLS